MAEYLRAHPFLSFSECSSDTTMSRRVLVDSPCFILSAKSSTSKAEEEGIGCLDSLVEPRGKDVSMIVVTTLVTAAVATEDSW